MGGAVLVIWLATPNLGMFPGPDGYVAEESEDLDGDSTTDTIVAEPGGPNPEQADPGEVYVVSRR